MPTPRASERGKTPIKPTRKATGQYCNLSGMQGVWLDGSTRKNRGQTARHSKRKAAAEAAAVPNRLSYRPPVAPDAGIGAFVGFWTGAAAGAAAGAVALDAGVA